MTTEEIQQSFPDLPLDLKKYRELLLANLVMLGEIPAPTFGESNRVEFLVNRFNEIGLTESSIDDCGNGVGVLRGTNRERAILLHAHADTIYNNKTDHTFQVTADTITGAAVATNSLGLAILATIPDILDDLNITLEDDLILLGGVKSLGRGDLKGIRFFLDNNSYNITEAISIEGVKLGRLSYSSIGMLRGEISCHVTPSYDWSGFGDESAILILNEAINKINDIRLPKRPRTSIILGSIIGGSSFNTIAKDATLGFEVRSESEKVVNDVATAIEEIVMEVSTKTGHKVDLDVFSKRLPGGTPYAHPLNQCARSIMEWLNIEPRMVPNTSDISALIDKEIPAVTIGITNGQNIHKLNESIEIEPIFHGLAQLIGILLAVDGGNCA